MEPVYNSPPLGNPSRLLLISGQPDIVAGSSSQFYRSASGTSLQQPTSKTSQQTATQLRPIGHCRSLFQSFFIALPLEPVYNSRPLRHPSRLLLSSSQPDIVAVSSSQLCRPASGASLQQPTSKTSQQIATQLRPTNIVATSSSQLYRSASGTSLQQRPLRHPSRLPLISGQPDIVAASSSQFYYSDSGTHLQQPTSETSRQTATQLRPTWHCRSLFQSTLSSRQWSQSTSADL